MAELPIRVTRGLPVVVARINGKPVRLILDTGADGVVVTPAAAERLGLERDFNRFGYATGLGAKASYWPTKPVAVELGTLSTAPKPLVVATLLAGDSGAPEGLLGGEILSTYDLDVDMGRRRLGFYEPRRCPNGPSPFPGPAFRVQAGRVGALRVTVPVTLDGRTVPLLVDTGASRTMADAAAAGVSDAALQADRAGRVSTADPVGLDVRLHAFKTLQLGNDVVNNPVLMVGRMEQPGYGGLLGMDYWRNHRLWISYGSGTLFIGQPSPNREAP